MDERLLELLADPETKEPLGAGAYPVVGGIPRFAGEVTAEQAQTRDSFSYKWARRDSYGTGESLDAAAEWFLARYGFHSAQAMREHFAGKRVLDVGCGAGFSASLWLDETWRPGLYVGADISDAVDVARERLKDVPGTAFVQADALRLPFRDESFDAVVSEGVYHHTPSTREALLESVRVLAPGGELLFYVYRRKAPVREFTDDYVRERISGLPPEQAWELLRPMTALGRSLAELNAEVDVPDDVELLGIPAGRYDVQRLVYWHFAKLFWDKRRPFDENVHTNFDWYHPRYAHRHTEDEVRAWCEEAGLELTRLDVQEAGITARAVKR